MPVKQLEANIRQEPALAIIELNGEIDGFAEETLEKAYQDAEASQPQTILLNFTDVNYINSTGIALIVSMLAKARKEHRQLAISNLSDHYKEIFQITRLADFMSIYPDERTAREALTKQE
jgi:anti-anti-sigma factor